ncbi:MAG: hypothetical protein ACRDY0_13210, partial [Acidimicrobiales bacterium]
QVVDGATAVAASVRAEPGLAVGQFYLGTILLDGGHPDQAALHFKDFLGDHPSAKWLGEAAPAIRQAFAQAGQPLPPGVPAAGS